MDDQVYFACGSGPVHFRDGDDPKEQARILAAEFRDYLLDGKLEEFEIRIGYSPSKRQWWRFTMIMGTVENECIRNLRDMQYDPVFQDHRRVLISMEHDPFEESDFTAVPRDEDLWIQDSDPELEVVVVKSPSGWIQPLRLL